METNSQKKFQEFNKKSNNNKINDYSSKYSFL